MNVGDKLIVDILDMGNNGEGVAKVDNFVVFVPFAISGEKVRVKVNHVRKNFAFADLEEVLIAVKGRVRPRCPVFGKCGGCALQHVDYPVQLGLKREIVSNCLNKIAGLDVAVDDVVYGSFPYFYRNKLQLPFGSENGKIVAGFFEKDSHNVVPITSCPLHGDWAEVLIKAVCAWANECKLSAYNETLGSGLLRHMVARFTGNALMLTIVINSEKLPSAEKLVRRIGMYFKNFSLYVSPNTKNTNVIMGDTIYPVAGGDTTVKIGSVSVAVSPYTFLQVNDEVRDLIYTAVQNEVDVNQDVIIDAYSGIGIMTALLAQKARAVYGIEIVPQAVEDADRLMQSNGIQNVVNIAGDASEKLPELVDFLRGEGGQIILQQQLYPGAPTTLNRDLNITVVLDPPRKGCDEPVLEAVLAANPDKIIYVSCNPATLARDVKYLSSAYTVVRATPFDMFPQTPHIETLVSLVKKS